MAASADVGNLAAGFLSPHRQLGGGGGESIFALDLNKIDANYWICFVGMICFCVLVDRGQAFLDYLAEESPTNKEFLSKIYTEMLLFGTVAVTVFILTTAAPNLSPNALTLITLTDVLCSMGACSLICLAGVTALLRKIYWHHWLHCETALQFKRQATRESKQASLENPLTAGALVEKTSTMARKSFIHIFSAADSATYELMSNTLMKALDVPNGFEYHLYLHRIMTRVCCDLMSIHWLNWLVLAGFGLICFVVDSIAQKGDGRKVQNYLTGVLIIYWCMLLDHVCIAGYVHFTYRSMVSKLQAGEALGPFKKFVCDRWGVRVGFVLQMIQLFNSFAVAFYLIHIRHILKKEGLEGWTPLVLLPLFCNILIVPYTLPRIVMVDGFFALDKVALEQVLADMQQSEEDVRYMFDLWIHRGAPDFASGLQDKLTLSDFRNSMALLNMHVSEARVKRLFKAFDTDRSGYIDMKELTNFLDALNAQAEDREVERNDRNSRHGEKKPSDVPTFRKAMTKIFPKRQQVDDDKYQELKAEQERLRQQVEKLQQDLQDRLQGLQAI